MKYPVHNCPECNAGDAEADAKGVGLILGFHPQDPIKMKLPGTIYFIGCSRCQYVGPIVLCKNGLNEKKVIDSWNEHITPGSTLSTSALVDELVKRDGVNEIPDHVDHCDLPAYFYGIPQTSRIIVVQEDGE